MFGIPSQINYIIFVKSIGVGFLNALLYGVFILIRKAGLNGKTTVLIQDLIFFLSSSVISFIFMYDINYGIPRAYIFFGELLGFLLFFLYKLPVK